MSQGGSPPGGTRTRHTGTPPRRRPAGERNVQAYEYRSHIPSMKTRRGWGSLSAYTVITLVLASTAISIYDLYLLGKLFHP